MFFIIIPVGLIMRLCRDCHSQERERQNTYVIQGQRTWDNQTLVESNPPRAPRKYPAKALKFLGITLIILGTCSVAVQVPFSVLYPQASTEHAWTGLWLGVMVFVLGTLSICSTEERKSLFYRMFSYSLVTVIIVVIGFLIVVSGLVQDVKREHPDQYNYGGYYSFEEHYSPAPSYDSSALVGLSALITSIVILQLILTFALVIVAAVYSFSARDTRGQVDSVVGPQNTVTSAIQTYPGAPGSLVQTTVNGQDVLMRQQMAAPAGVHTYVQTGATMQIPPPYTTIGVPNQNQLNQPMVAGAPPPPYKPVQG